MRFYNVHKLIAYRQTPLPPVCPAFYPHTNVCLFVPVASYDHLSVRPCIRMSPSVCSCIHVWPSVCPTLCPHVTVCTCIRIWSSVCPTLYPHVTICYPLYPYMTLCLSLSLLISACYRLFTLVSACDCPSVLVSACYRLFAFVSVYDRLSVRPSIHILRRWIWHFWAQWKKIFGALCTHGCQLTIQIDYAIYSRVWHKICNTSKLFGTTERWGS